MDVRTRPAASTRCGSSNTNWIDFARICWPGLVLPNDLRTLRRLLLGERAGALAELNDES
jgi:hypothetical protein